MSIASQITRIQQDRNTIRAKLVELGLATNVDNLDVLAAAIEGIENKGSVTATVKEGETYTIPKGYHTGTGTVSGIAGGGNYSLQSKAAITPTKQQQQITPDDGFYGLSDVTIGAIPDAYQDVTSVTAGAGDVLVGKTIVDAKGTVVEGSMANNGAVEKTLTVADPSFTVAAGYHNGAGVVKIDPEAKTVTPTKSVQKVTASTGKVLSEVEVAAIPAEYQVVTEVDATDEDVLEGKKIVDAEGNVVEGTMANNGAVTKVLDTTTDNQSVVIAKGYHNGEGSVSIVLEQKSVTPTKEAQTITPATGKVLSKVSVAAIPDAYQDVTAVDAEAAHVLEGKKIVDSTGAVVTGSMVNNGAITATIDGLTATSYTVPAGYHDGTGTVSVTSDIEEALAAI